MLTDRQGSLRALYNASGVVQRFSYDAWGNRRSISGGSLTDSEKASLNSITSRGYTLHEHMDEFGLINMNARLYDPQLGMFVSTDPKASDYYNTYPYSYCSGDPLNRVDPTGEAWFRYKDNFGEWIYEWRADIYSQEDAESLQKGAEYIDLTHMGGDVYYSLFGSVIDNSDPLLQKLYMLVDAAIISHADYIHDLKTYYSYGGESLKQPTIDLFIEEVFAKDSQYLIPIDTDRNNYYFEYEGSSYGIYRVAQNKDNMRQSMIDWIGNSDMPKDIGGWSTSKKMYHIRFSNNKNFEALHLKFDSRAASILLNKYKQIFKY
ncbi:MAG: RHS repeat-associated core domain-containing protein [Bacteroides sp.]|nr:RHS repeat-associated core domain-containing protein [Bacteroides sp.]